MNTKEKPKAKPKKIDLINEVVERNPRVDRKSINRMSKHNIELWLEDLLKV